MIARDGRLHRSDDETRSESYADILARAGLAELEGSGKGAPRPRATEDHALQAHGAVFAEVKVDPDLGQVRATRLVGAFAAGRIINPRLARSQLYGGMIWGVSFALHEAAIFDRRSGRVVNADLGEYHVPVNADVPSLEALLVHEDDPHVNALGIKGVGEIGITGSVGCRRECDLACDRDSGPPVSGQNRGPHSARGISLDLGKSIARTGALKVPRIAESFERCAV